MFIEKSAIIGWIGSFLILLAYFLNSLGYLDNGSFWYPFINLIGSSFLMFRVYIKKVWSLFVLNLVWFLIAIYSLYKYFNF